MENYVVRIYRRHKARQQNMLGIVECVEKESKHVFSTIEELWDVLSEGSAALGLKSRCGTGDGVLDRDIAGALIGSSARREQASAAKTGQRETKQRMKKNKA